MKNMDMTARILRPLLERQQSAWLILSSFGETRKTEADFWQRFAGLPSQDKAFLARFYDTQTPWALFRRICVFWNVPISRNVETICLKTKDP